MLTVTEMCNILRGEVLYESPEQIQEKLNTIADWIEKHDAPAVIGDKLLCENEKYVVTMVTHKKDGSWSIRASRMRTPEYQQTFPYPAKSRDWEIVTDTKDGCK